MKLKLRIFGGKITRVSINICTTMENKRGEAWTHEETVLLIELWGDQRVQEQLQNMPKRNLEIFKLSLSCSSSFISESDKATGLTVGRVPKRPSNLSQ
jgi:hypothetical protein